MITNSRFTPVINELHHFSKATNNKVVSIEKSMLENSDRPHENPSKSPRILGKKKTYKMSVGLREKEYNYFKTQAALQGTTIEDEISDLLRSRFPWLSD